MTRCFLGFELSEASRRYLRQRLLPLHDELANGRRWAVRMVPPENWHATLLFFASLEQDERARVWETVEMAVREGVWSELAFDWQGLALWPSPRRPGLICLEAAPYPDAADWPLTALLNVPPFSKGDVEHLKRYRPHITVMRFRRGRGARLPKALEWEALLPALPRFDADAVRVERVSFFLSTVTPEQPIYPRERSLPLAG